MGSFNQERLKKAMAMYADDVLEDVTLAQKVSGAVELEKFFADFVHPAADEHVFAVVEYTGGAEAVRSNGSGERGMLGKFLGAPAAGKSTEARGVSTLSFRNGKITSQHDYWDSSTVLRQLGQ